MFSASLLGDGAGLNLLIVAVPAALGAYFAARAAGRQLRPWTLVWALGGVALLAVPALRDAGWPTFLAVVSSLALASLALNGGRTWPGVLLGPLGLPGSLGIGMAWGWGGLRTHAAASNGRVAPILRTGAVAALLLVVFGALFAGADAAFADLLSGLIPDASVDDGPWRFLLFLLGLVGALAAARLTAAPLHWDRLEIRPGRARSRWEWALPLVVLNLLFATFIAVQLAVLFGGYDKVLSETGLTYSEYARQGFWQLLFATLLTLAVIALATRWAPRSTAGDRTLVRGVLGTLCVLTLVVVASALRRMDLYVDAYGLTRLRVSVAAMELWLGLVIVLIMMAGAYGVKWLPRAVAASAAAAVLAFGLASPDGLVAERNVQRYERTGKIDIDYLQELSADAVPALDGLPEPLRTCALEEIARDLEERDDSWHATSWGEHRARGILAEHGVADEVLCDAIDSDRFDDHGDRDGYGEWEQEGELGPSDDY
ncbi:DUF4153 domain-containing protein [Streptomyces xantholiticus]|uniref:DUF4153 domain-containing protein n=1 Tax=Streptomyces xantholiticus TaxID=68285 RepID=UPI003D9E3179